jgi:hypothetical protein
MKLKSTHYDQLIKMLLDHCEPGFECTCFCCQEIHRELNIRDRNDGGKMRAELINQHDAKYPPKADPQK